MINNNMITVAYTMPACMYYSVDNGDYGFGLWCLTPLLIRLTSEVSRLVIATNRTVGSPKKFVRITSGFGGGEFTKFAIFEQ
jgi:hypothetical protein